MLTEAAIIVMSGVLIIWFWLHHVVNRIRHEAPFLHEKDETALPDPAPLISVLIAARDEAHNIGRTLESILAQTYPNFEVLVVDDRSEDETADIVRKFARADDRLRFFRCTELPDDWTGKNHALWQISQLARGGILLFVDADVALDPAALSVMVSNLIRERADMLSLVLRLDSRSAWEHAIHLVIGAIILLRFPLHKVNDPSSRHAMANGQAIMVRADAYRAVGGHSRVRAIMLEDMAFARLMKREGRRYVFAYGFDMGAVRWYPSLRDIWHGWGRIYYNVFQGNLAELLNGVFLLGMGMLVPCLTLILTVVHLLAGGFSPTTLGLLILTLCQIAVMKLLFLRLCVFSRCKFRYVAMLFPTAALALGIVLSGIVRRLTSRGITWKGKRYEVLFEPTDADEPEPEPVLVEMGRHEPEAELESVAGLAERTEDGNR